MPNNIKLDYQNKTAIITLDKDDKINFLDLNDILNLNDILFTLKDKVLDFVLIQAGLNHKVFCAGISIADHLYPRFPAMLAAFSHMYHLLRNLKSTTICLCNGSAIGGGLEIAIACDYIIASDRAKFSLPEITLNVFPPIACYILPRIINPENAIDLICSGKKIDVIEAKKIGLIDQITVGVQNFEPLQNISQFQKRENRFNKNLSTQDFVSILNTFQSWANCEDIDIVKACIKNAICIGIKHENNYLQALKDINIIYSQLMENEQVNNTLIKFLQK